MEDQRGAVLPATSTNARVTQFTINSKVYIFNFSFVWTAKFEVTNIINDITIQINNLGENKISEQPKLNQPVNSHSHRVIVQKRSDEWETIFYIKEFVESTSMDVYHEEHFSNDGVSQGYLSSHVSTAESGIDFEWTFPDYFAHVNMNIKRPIQMITRMIAQLSSKLIAKVIVLAHGMTPQLILAPNPFQQVQSHG